MSKVLQNLGSRGIMVAGDRLGDYVQFYNPKPGIDLMDILSRIAMMHSQGHNHGNNNPWGVYFYDNKAFLLAGYFFVKIENILPANNGSFFDLVDGSVEPLSEKYISAMDRTTGSMKVSDVAATDYLNFIMNELNPLYHGRAVFPIDNILNRLNVFGPEDIKRTCVILGQHVHRNNECVLEFDEEILCQKGGFRFIVSEKSRIPLQMIMPHKKYTCVVVDRRGNDIIVDVILEYAESHLGIMYSKNGYRLRELGGIEKVNNLDFVPRDMIIYSNDLKTVEDYPVIPPIHVQASCFRDFVSLFAATNSRDIEIHYSAADPLAPIMITNQVLGEPVLGTDLKITVLLAPLNQDRQMFSC